MELISGKELQNGKYRIIDVLGQGGFGITYLAQQVSLGRKVAIKEFFMKEHCNRDETSSFVSVPSMGSRDLVEHFKQKFLKEARTIASFTSSSIVNVFDVFEENGTAYYVMEYLEGDSLKAIIDREGAIPEETAVKYIRQIGSALSEIHSKKLVHLDIKPANIMLNFKGEAVLIDFGISKHYDETGSQTSSGLVGLSEGYAPMEQYKKGGLTSFSPATDIYSLGATLFKLLTGQTPPHASDVNDDGLPALPQHLSANVRAAIEASMQPRRKDRPQSIAEFLEIVESGKWKDDIVQGTNEGDSEVTFAFREKPSTSTIERSTEETHLAGAVISNNSEKSQFSGSCHPERSEPSVDARRGQSQESYKHANREILPPSGRQNDNSGKWKDESGERRDERKGLGGTSKKRWAIVVAILVIIGAGAMFMLGGAAGGFMFFGGGGDVKPDSVKIDSVKDTSVQPPPIDDPIHVVEQTAELVIIGAPDGANVYVDGEYFDETPLKGATISIGEHTIKVVKEGYETYEKTHTFNSQSVAIDVNIKKSTALLNLSTNPSGASVYVDGDFIGMSNLSGYNVEQGNHTIKITKQGYKDIVETHNFSSGSKDLSFNLSEKDITPSEAYSKGVAAYNEKDYSEAVKWYRKAAEQGHAGAQNWLGVCYQKGYGVSQSWSEAVIWFRKAAEQGEMYAQSILGVCYENGKGVLQSYSEAVKWYSKAAEQGDMYAQYNLGVCYENGKGVLQSYSEAVKWYSKAAEQGQANAQCNLGGCYYHGNGVSQSYSEALEWFRKAENNGNANAQNWLGLCYERGHGVPKNISEAVKWYRKAAARGEQFSKDALKRLGY